jgi:hypothetical protein
MCLAVAQAMQKQRKPMDVQECLTKLAESDKPCAKAKALMKGLELKLKRVKASEYLKADAKTSAEREFMAYNSGAYADTAKSYEAAIMDYEILANQRNTWQMGFEYWRSNNANRRQAGGNL